MDVSTCFCSDTYWKQYYESDNRINTVRWDPDIRSREMREAHKECWNRTLPNGQQAIMEIVGTDLYMNNMKVGCDSISISLRHKTYQRMICQVADGMKNWDDFIEDFIRRSYTIGGSIIFPKHQGSINQARGINRRISDRFDLTLECIRRHYAGDDSPLSRVIQKDSIFFDMFVDFKGYVEFFCLQDLVNEDYSKVQFWIGNGDFNSNPLPATPEEYLVLIEKEIKFLESRNKRIADLFD